MDDLEKKIIDHVQAAYPRMVLTPSGVRAVLDAISASGEWAVVPVEPSKAMLEAGSKKLLRLPDYRPLLQPLLVWQAMLQARPKV